MRRIIVCCCLLFAVCIAQTFVTGQTPKRVPRAKPPTFTDKDGSDIFFNDVFAEALVGERSFAKPTPGGTPVVVGPGTGLGEAPAEGGLYPWSSIITALAIEDEIKKIKLEVDQDVTTPTKFASNGYKQVRRNFSMLAMLFAIAGEYDKDVRWKKDAPELRDSFARAAANARVGSTQAYNEAKLRKEDLQTILSGGSVAAIKPSERKVEEWRQIVDRAPLMQRLEISQQGIIQPGTATADEFKSNTEELVQEANIVAAISEVFMQETMDDGEEEEYSVHAKQMKDAALDIIKAAQLDNSDMARQAAGQIGQACSNCHSDWR